MLTSLIPQWAQDRIRSFVDEVFLPRAVTIAVEPPAAMVAGDPVDGDWFPWKAVDSPVSDGDILQLEKAIGAPLPPLFRAYLMYKCLLMTDFGILSLPKTPADDPLGAFRRYVVMMDEEPCFRPRGFVPFAQDGNDGGPLNFDVRRPTPQGDYPVIYTDHELLHRPDYQGQQRWASFEELLEALEADMRSFDKP
jgi:hypothetical protein